MFTYLLCILIEFLSRARAKGGKKAIIISSLALLLVFFRVTTLTSMAVKGLNVDLNVYSSCTCNVLRLYGTCFLPV